MYYLHHSCNFYNLLFVLNWASCEPLVKAIVNIHCVIQP